MTKGKCGPKCKWWIENGMDAMCTWAQGYESPFWLYDIYPTAAVYQTDNHRTCPCFEPKPKKGDTK